MRLEGADGSQVGQCGLAFGALECDGADSGGSQAHRDERGRAVVPANGDHRPCPLVDEMPGERRALEAQGDRGEVGSKLRSPRGADCGLGSVVERASLVELMEYAGQLGRQAQRVGP